MAFPLIGLLAVSILGLWGCSRVPEKNPSDSGKEDPPKDAAPKKSTPEGASPPSLYSEIKACRVAMQSIPRSSENCDISAEVRFAELTPDPSDNLAIRPKVLERMEDHYYRYYRLHTPLERLQHQDSLLMSTIRATLFSGNYGATWSEAQMDDWLQKMEAKLDKKLEAGVASTPLQMKDLDQLKKPVEVLTQNLPKELKDLAKNISFSREISLQLNLKSPKNTLWDFIQQNLKVVYFTSRASELPDPSLLGQMYSPFLKAVMVDTERWKGLLGNQYLLGILSTLAHETYHVFYLRKLATRNPKLTGAVLLDERNGHLMSALVLEKFFPQIENSPENAKLQKNTAAKIAGYYLDVYGANLALGFPLHDETFRIDISSNFPKSLLKEHPEKQIHKYLKKRSLDLNSYLVELFSRIHYHPAEFPEIRIRPDTTSSENAR